MIRRVLRQEQQGGLEISDSDIDLAASPIAYPRRMLAVLQEPDEDVVPHLRRLRQELELALAEWRAHNNGAPRSEAAGHRAEVRELPGESSGLLSTSSS